MGQSPSAPPRSATRARRPSVGACRRPTRPRRPRRERAPAKAGFYTKFVHHFEQIQKGAWSITSCFQACEAYGSYSLEDIPIGARPQPGRKHRSTHSYPVDARVQDPKGNLCDVTVDVLLRAKAYYIKKATPVGRLGQISWKKFGGPHPAWCIALEQAACGNAGKS